MGDVQVIQLTSITLRLDAEGNIIGLINKDRLYEELKNAETNRDGCVKFAAEVRAEVSDKGHTHFLPIVINRASLRQAYQPLPLNTVPTNGSYITNDLDLNNIKNQVPGDEPLY